MADPKVVKEWINKADEDYKFAKANLEEGGNFYSQICFHFHQAAEKYLKSFIIAYDLEFEKVHNLMYRNFNKSPSPLPLPCGERVRVRG